MRMVRTMPSLHQQWQQTYDVSKRTHSKLFHDCAATTCTVRVSSRMCIPLAMAMPLEWGLGGTSL